MRQSMLACLVFGAHSTLSIPVQSDLSKGIINFFTRPRSSSGITRRQNHGSSLKDESDHDYLANIKLGGVDLQVFLDTGSSDLYVTKPIPSGKSTGVIGSTAFGDGTAIEGPIEVAPLEFAGYTIPQQAFIQSDPSQDRFQGLIGLGPDRNSVISNQLTSGNGEPNVLGNSPLANILKDNANMLPILTLTLGRSDSGRSNDSSQGTITVGQVLPGFEAINDQTKLDIFIDPAHESGVREWKVLLDKDGFKVNGKSIPLPPSNISSPDQLVVLLDAGTSLPQVPTSVAAAIYGSVPGASFVEKAGWWQVPCDVEFNVSWTFGGKDIPMHPLDTTQFDPTDDSNKTCIGSWMPEDPDVLRDNNNDGIFGMAFLRSVYTLINMGNAVGSANPGFNQNAKPFAQLLGIVDPAKAHEEFLTERVPGYVSPQGSATGTSTSGKSSPSPGTGSGAAKSGARSFTRHAKLGVTVLTVVVGNLIALG